MRYQGIIVENNLIKAEWRKGGCREQFFEDVNIPMGVTDTVPPEIYGEYRRGRDSACVDMVIVTRLPTGDPAVMLSMRKPTVCFGGKWWIYGGALQAYVPDDEFVSRRATRECGVEVKPEVLIGVYRTCAGDHIGSTLQPCYAARVSYDAVMENMKKDEGHTDVRLFTLEQLRGIPKV